MCKRIKVKSPHVPPSSAVAPPDLQRLPTSTWGGELFQTGNELPFYRHAACWLLPPQHHCFIIFTCGWQRRFSFPPLERDRFKPKLFHSAQHDNIQINTSCLKTVQSASTHRCADGGGEVSESTKHFWSFLGKHSCSQIKYKSSKWWQTLQTSCARGSKLNLHTYLRLLLWLHLIFSVFPRPREEGNSSKLQMSFCFMDTLPVGSSLLIITASSLSPVADDAVSPSYQ